MSEKEKKAIENVKRMFEDITIEELIKDKNLNITIYSLGILDILRVIAIVENQQKEIEDLRIIADDIEEHNIVYTDTPEFEDRFISKDKIRDKIKDIEDLMILFTNDKEKFNRYKYARNILEKLLGEERK